MSTTPRNTTSRPATPKTTTPETTTPKTTKTTTSRHEPVSADAAVIGSGIAGMTAAALLAKRGYRVVVLERDVHPGGCAAGFSQDGYRFAVGATVAMGFEPGGIHRRIYDMLGLEPRYVNVRPAIRVHMPDRVVNIETERQAWLNELARAFPGQDEAKRGFWNEMASLASAMRHVSQRFPVMPFKHLYDVVDTARGAHPKLLPVLFNLRKTVGDKLDRYGIDDPAHNAFVDGQLLDAMQTTSDDCVVTSGALALDIYRYGCQYKIGGLESIARDLADYVTAHSGTVRYASRVSAILHDDDGVKGVATNRGEVHAPVVVSAIPLENTAELLEHPQQSNLSSRAAALPNMWGAFTLYLGVDERALPDNVHYFEQVTDLDVHGEAGNMLISISPHWDRSRAPAGKRAMTASTHVDAAHWLALAADKERYVTEKRRLETKMLDQIERALPNVREGIEVLKSGSPRTFKNFTLRAGGTVGGFPQLLGVANFAAPSHRTDISGPFLAGDTVFPGQGTIGVSVSGYNAARSATRFLTRRPRHVS